MLLEASFKKEGEIENRPSRLPSEGSETRKLEDADKLIAEQSRRELANLALQWGTSRTNGALIRTTGRTWVLSDAAKVEVLRIEFRGSMHISA